MPNIASVLKDEIARISRKEIRSETEALKSASAKLRSDAASLKRQIASLEKQIQGIVRGKPEQPSNYALKVPPKSRFSAKGFASQRKRLGLSAESMGKLIGVSGLSVYHWEGGKSRPRAKYLPAIAALKTLGRKSAAEVLASR